ncbi:uncharacterized protein RJT20DRAFT_11047 [Scheffersomyces xylosifermentans]|uniref:uncharacterized protein n=1 Tax=Scheffersomyces xylosifermentans TaxID=1304137 RepID=UPI00315CF299
MTSRKKLGYSAFGAFLGVSVYKRLEIKGNYIHSSSIGLNPSNSLSSLYNSVQTLTSTTTSLSSFNQNFLHLAVLGIFLLLNFIKWAIFGRLSGSEIRSLKHKINYTMWEFFFGFIIFYSKSSSKELRVIQNELFKFAGLFLSVLLLKCFHYLSVDRANTIFNSTHSNTRAEVKYMGFRLLVGLILLAVIDAMLIGRFFFEVHQNYYCSVQMTELSKVTLQENILTGIFGFEILHMMPLIILTGLKYGLDFYEYFRIGINTSNNEEDVRHKQWKESKMRITYFSEFIVNFVQFVMLCVFSGIFLYLYTFPFHILPSSYLSLRVLVDKTRRLVNYKKKQIILSKLTIPEDQVALQDKCIICFDELVKVDGPIEEIRGIAHCSHHFHYDCLKKWLSYSNSCPVCRKKL